jgi:hypothetical protein
MYLNRKHEFGVNYTASQLEALYGPDWKKLLKLDSPPTTNKPPVYKYEDFDEHHKTIYLAIYEIIAEINNDPSVLVYATGSRIKGKWKTAEEAQQLSIQHQRVVKPSDYDYFTLAKSPPKSYFKDKLGIVVDLNRDWVPLSRLVLITPLK